MAHLLRTLEETWSPTAPRVLLSPQSPALLKNLLVHIHDQPVLGAGSARRVAAVGCQLVGLRAKRSPQGRAPDLARQARCPAHAEVANLFTSGLLSIHPQDALEFLRTPPPPEECAFLLERQMYEDLHSQNHAALLL